MIKVGHSKWCILQPALSGWCIACIADDRALMRNMQSSIWWECCDSYQWVQGTSGWADKQEKCCQEEPPSKEGSEEEAPWVECMLWQSFSTTIWFNKRLTIPILSSKELTRVWVSAGTPFHKAFLKDRDHDMSSNTKWYLPIAWLY